MFVFVQSKREHHSIVVCCKIVIDNIVVTSNVRSLNETHHFMCTEQNMVGELQQQ